MKNTKMYNTKNILKQYKDSKNLSTRISLYSKYSTNKQDYGDWLFLNYKFFKGCKVLEMGSGTGGLWDRIENLPINSQLVISDFSPGMVDELKIKFLHLDNIDIKQIDIQDIPFDDESFDIVIANSMLYHVPDIDKAIKEVARVMKSDGTFYTATSGNKSMFVFLKATLPDIDLGITMPDSITFTLDNGSKFFKNYLSEVKIHIYNNDVEITDTNDLVNFIYSVPSIEGLDNMHREKIFDYYENKKDSNGIINIPIKYGTFVAKK